MALLTLSWRPALTSGMEQISTLYQAQTGAVTFTLITLTFDQRFIIVTFREDHTDLFYSIYDI